jgi:protein SCO1/2
MRIISLILLELVFSACGNTSDDKKYSENTRGEKLPFLGQYKLIDNGEGGSDTLYHKVGDFQLVNQDSVEISNEDVEGKIYVADFFFTSCPTICPKMKAQMLRVYDSIQDEPDVLILSHTIDPEYDTVALLKEFSEQLGVTGDKWHFLTGNKDDIYKLGQSSYMVTAIEDPAEPGGFIHSGAFLLVDRQGHIRGVYDGTDPVEVNDLIQDINKLKREDKQQ